MIVARAVFAWFPAGYGKSSCYQLLAFVYDFKPKWTRYRGNERNVVCAVAGIDQVVYVFLLRTSPFTFTGYYFMVMLMRVRTTVDFTSLRTA